MITVRERRMVERKFVRKLLIINTIVATNIHNTQKYCLCIMVIHYTEPGPPPVVVTFDANATSFPPVLV